MGRRLMIPFAAIEVTLFLILFNLSRLQSLNQFNNRKYILAFILPIPFCPVSWVELTFWGLAVLSQENRSAMRGIGFICTLDPNVQKHMELQLEEKS